MLQHLKLLKRYVPQETIKNFRLKRFTRPSETVQARLEMTEGNATLQIGQRSVFSVPLTEHGLNQNVFDFAVFAVCALSMSQNLNIQVKFPVSQSIVARVSELSSAYRLWSIDVLAPLRVQFDEVIPDIAPATGGGGILCLSGGVDSLSAAIDANSQTDLKAGILIAGADYPSGTSPGFIQLRNRVQKNCDILGIELRVLETNLKSSGFHWEMLHSFLLSYVLHAHSEEFEFGAFAQDNTPVQDIFRMPWGNLNVLPALFSTTSFPMKSFGADRNRVAKIRQIRDFSQDMLRNVSVCFADRSTGSNCGRCPKCIQYRLALVAIDEDPKGFFNDMPDLVASIRNWSIPKKISTLRGLMARTIEIVDALPDGELRSELSVYERRLRSEFHRRMPTMR